MNKRNCAVTLNKKIKKWMIHIRTIYDDNNRSDHVTILAMNRKVPDINRIRTGTNKI